MMPIDITHQEFSRSFRGYATEEVDEYLARIADEYEKIVDEKARLQSEIEGWQRKVQQFEEMEQTMRSALMSAQKAGDDMRQEAEKDADIIRREAELERERMLNELAELQQQKERFKIEFRTLLETHLRMLE